MQKHIYLSGFMGVGKTRVGRALAKRLGVDFFDTDTLIVDKTGTSIAEIFQKLGEAHFRDLETQTLRALQTQDPAVISLGGGVILKDENRAILKTGHWIFLHRPLTVIAKQLKFNQARPLLQRETWQDLYHAREPLYRLATHTLECGTTPLAQICDHILNLLDTK